MFDFKSIINTINNLEWKKYFYKNFAICFLVFVAIFSVIVAMVIKSYKSVVLNEQNRYCYEVSNNTAARINDILEDETRSYNSFITEASMDFLILSYNKNMYDEECIDAMQKIQNVTKQYTGDVIDSIYVYNPFSQYIISTSGEFTNNFYDRFLDTKWIDEYYSEKKTIQSRTAKRKNITRDYMTFIRTITSNKNEGLIAYNVNKEKFKGKISKDVRELYLLDKQNNIVLSLNEDFIGEKLEKTGKKCQYILQASDMIQNKIFMYDNAFFCGANLSNGEYTLVTEINNSHINKKINGMWVVFVLFGVGMLVIAFFWSFWLVMKLYGNLIDLVLTVDGKKPFEKKSKSIDEVTFVKNKILLMLDKNEKIENELANKINLVNKTKMAALQSQLNPHFIHNTLNLIGLLDIKDKKRDTDASKALSALGDILRYAMDKSSYSVPLAQELEYAKKYVYIQMLKYNERFDVTFDIAEETLNLKVLKMTIQPLIENSVFHGILPCDRFCNICIRSYIDKEVLKISVTDNGVGINEETLNALKQGVNNEKFDKAHTHGLLNVNQRCMLFYGDDYGCEINSEREKTEIIIKYPLFKVE